MGWHGWLRKHGPHSKKTREWSDFEDARDLPAEDLVKIFSSTEWTKIAILRDPWTRAVSQFQDQVRRGEVDYRASSRNDFLEFTRRREGNGGHTGTAVKNCGFDVFTYD